jgi:hypothetical protein
MNDIIDNEFTNKDSNSLQTISKWILIGILGCIVFQGFGYISQMLITNFLEIRGIAGNTTSFLLSELISLVLSLVIFNDIIKFFKKRYYANEIDLQKTIQKLVVFYIIILIVEFFYPLIIESFYVNHYSEVPDPLAPYASWFNFIYPIGLLIKYGFVTWILLKTE